MKIDHWFEYTDGTTHKEIFPSPSMCVTMNGFLK